MAALGQHFDANAVEPNAPLEILPPGDYLVQIVRSDMKPTKNGAGQYLELEMSILEGQYANRRLFDRLNLVNANQTAQDIAHRTLSAICHATGQLGISDSDALHFKPLIAVVKMTPAKGEYGPRNDIGGYKPAGGGVSHRPAAATPVAGKPASGGSVPPWRRNSAA